MKGAGEFILAILKEIISVIGKIITTLISNNSQNKNGKVVKKDDVVEIPRKVDPISYLKGDVGGIKSIEQMEPLSDEYYKALTTRLALQKNQNTKITISRSRKHE